MTKLNKCRVIMKINISKKKKDLDKTVVRNLRGIQPRETNHNKSVK